MDCISEEFSCKVFPYLIKNVLVYVLIRMLRLIKKKMWVVDKKNCQYFDLLKSERDL